MAAAVRLAAEQENPWVGGDRKVNITVVARSSHPDAERTAATVERVLLQCQRIFLPRALSEGSAHQELDGEGGQDQEEEGQDQEEEDYEHGDFDMDSMKQARRGVDVVVDPKLDTQELLKLDGQGKVLAHVNPLAAAANGEQITIVYPDESTTEEFLRSYLISPQVKGPHDGFMAVVAERDHLQNLLLALSKEPRGIGRGVAKRYTPRPAALSALVSSLSSRPHGCAFLVFVSRLWDGLRAAKDDVFILEIMCENEKVKQQSGRVFAAKAQEAGFAEV